MKRFMQVLWEGYFARHCSDAIFLPFSFTAFMMKDGQSVFCNSLTF